MSKFNEKVEKETLVNHMGKKAYKQDPREELVFAVLTTFVSDSYYEAEDKRLERIHTLVDTVAKTDPMFVAKLAVYARKEAHMRSVFPVLVGRLTQVHRGDSLVRKAIIAGTQRPDDLTELAGYLKLKLTNQVKKGIAEALNKFDSYQMAKYKGEGKSVKLVDLLNLVHPKFTNKESAEAAALLVSDQLKNTDTWESQLSAGGDKNLVFKNLLKEKKLGYMALLRNLRNILETKDEETIDLAIAYLTNETAVRNSKQLPFRFLSAYNAIESVGEISQRNKTKNAIEVALQLSINNIPELRGKTVVLSDNSGSMHGGGTSATSAYSNIKTSDIANLFAVLYWTRTNNVEVGLFGDKLIRPALKREDGVFANFKTISREANRCGGATEEGLFEMFNRLIENREMVDRIVIFSDCQVGNGARWYGSTKGYTYDNFNKLFQQYKAINPAAKVYSIDLKGYGNSMIAGDDALCITGWSEKIFDIMEKHEIDSGAMIKEIEKIYL